MKTPAPAPVSSVTSVRAVLGVPARHCIVASLAVFALALAVSACGGAGRDLADLADLVVAVEVTDHDDASATSSLAAPGPTEQTVSLATSLERSDVFAALEGCVPAEDEDFTHASDQVALAAIGLIESDGELFVEVTIANTAPYMALDYPGTALQIVGGDALLPLSDGGTEADWLLYGLEACSADVHRYALSWGALDEAKLTALARSDVGATERDRWTFVLARD